jgi:hypothetical protein
MHHRTIEHQPRREPRSLAPHRGQVLVRPLTQEAIGEGACRGTALGQAHGRCTPRGKRPAGAPHPRPAATRASSRSSRPRPGRSARRAGRETGRGTHCRSRQRSLVGGPGCDAPPRGLQLPDSGDNGVAPREPVALHDLVLPSGGPSDSRYSPAPSMIKLPVFHGSSVPINRVGTV